MTLHVQIHVASALELRFESRMLGMQGLISLRTALAYPKCFDCCKAATTVNDTEAFKKELECAQNYTARLASWSSIVAGLAPATMSRSR